MQREELVQDTISMTVTPGVELGKGSAGLVYKGSLDGVTVALKQIVGEQVEQSDIVREMDIMLQLPRHLNVITLLGVCILPLVLIMEFGDKVTMKFSFYKLYLFTYIIE